MRSRGKRIIVLLLVLLFSLVSAEIQTSDIRADSVEFKVNRVVWGDNLDSPIKAYPGDSEVPLTVEVQNLSPDKTIRGVVATLLLDGSPFTDVYGKSNASATGAPTVGDVLSPTDKIEPKSFFTLTFTLDIDEDAVPGAYKQTMIVNYSVESGNEFVEGVPQNLTVEIVVSKIASTITVSVSPQVIEEGEAVRVSGSISPAPRNGTVTLMYLGPERNFTSKVDINLDGTFAESFRPDVNGTWSVNASWSGDLKYEGAWSSFSFEVRPKVSLSIVTSNNRIIGGFDNVFSIKIINDGRVPVSAVEASLTVPNPLIVHGRSSWSINYFDVGDSAEFDLVIYAPDSSIGSTYSGSLTINYRDAYAQSHTDTFPIGLVIIGRVELVLYERSIRPGLALNGSKVEITATLLNKGTVSAMYVNATIMPSSILSLTSESSTYIGEVEENSQSPFTLNAYVREDAKNGTYPIIMRISYRDDQHVDNAFNTTFYLTVLAMKSEPPASQDEIDAFISSFEQIIILSTVLAASVAVLLLYRRHLGRRDETVRSGEA